LEQETFVSLLTNAAHWEFELFLMCIFDIFLGMLVFPSFKKWVLHHKTDDQKIKDLENEISSLREQVKKILPSKD